MYLQSKSHSSKNGTEHVDLMSIKVSVIKRDVNLRHAWVTERSFKIYLQL